MKRAACYLRVSTTEQGSDQHVSLPVQEARCRAYVEQHGWSLIAVETDMESGLRPQRPGYNRVLQLAREGHIDVVVVMAASRWGRDAAEVLTRAKELADLKVELASCSEDLSSFLMLGLQAVLNQEESRRLSARIVPAKRFKVSQGYNQAHAPFGTVSDKGILKPGPDYELLQNIFRWYIEGASLRELTRRVNALITPRSLVYETIRKILINESYIGILHWRGETFPALWEPLIDVEIFRKAGEKLRSKYHTRTRLHALDKPYWILGLAHCAWCGKVLSFKRSHRVYRGQFRYTYDFLFCATGKKFGLYCPGSTTKQIRPLQDWVVSQLRQFSLSDIDRVVAEVEQYEQGEQQRLESHREAVSAEITRLQSRIQRAEQGYLDGLWGADRVLSIKAGLDDQIYALQRELGAIEAHRPTSDMQGLRSFFETDDWLEGADRAPEEFRELLRGLVSRVIVKTRDEYEIEYVAALTNL